MRLVDAVFDPDFCHALYEAIVEGREMLGRTGAVWSHARVDDLDLGDGTASPRIQQTAQGETFIQYGPDLTLKLFRNIEPGIHPDLELRRYLTDRTSFENLSPVYGALEYESRGHIQSRDDAEESRSQRSPRGHCSATCVSPTSTRLEIPRHHPRCRSAGGLPKTLGQPPTSRKRSIRASHTPPASG